MDLVEYARSELERAGLFDEDSDYEGKLGECILECVKTFSQYGHSGMSAALATHALTRLLSWEPLTPLTNNPKEWTDHSLGHGSPLWQSRRNPAAFSTDGGITYCLVSDNNRVIHTSEEAK